MSTYALIPAAGHSQRMGRPKLALPVGSRTVLEAVIEVLRTGGAEKVLVVLAPHVAFLEAPARTAGAEVLLLPAATPDMRTTVQRGLDWIEAHWQPAPTDRWLLTPADHPVLEVAVVRALSAALDERPDASIAIPTHQGKRGHPALISWKHVARLRAFPSNEGLNRFLRQMTAETVEVAWPDDSVTRDLDTPEDYERMMKSRLREG